MAIVVMIFFTVLGNLGVIAAVCVYRRMQTFTNMLLVSLASADLLLGSLIMPPAMLYLLRDQWPFSPFVCRLWATLDVLLCTVSFDQFSGANLN